MGVMEIVDNPDVGKSDRLDEPNLVLRFPIPTAVVVQSDLATDVLGRQSDFTDSPRLRLDKGFGLLGIHRDISPPADPQLRMDLMLFNKAQYRFGFVV